MALIEGYESLSVWSKLRISLGRFHWQRVQRMRNNWQMRQQNAVMLILGIPICLFCIIWLVIVNDPKSSHPFNIGANLFFGGMTLVSGLGFFWNVKLWIDSRKSK
jgi:hypothetical protein